MDELFRIIRWKWREFTKLGGQKSFGRINRIVNSSIW